MIEILDSETFYYDSEDSHQGRHTVLRTLMPGYCWFEPGQYLWTVQDDTDYLWRPDSNGELRWIGWRQFGNGWTEMSKMNRKQFAEGWEEIQREELLAIEMNPREFFVGDVAALGLGSEIEIIPRRVYEQDYFDSWVVDLKIPTGFDTCRFLVYGKARREWMMKRAILDELMIIALRKYQFQEVVI